MKSSILALASMMLVCTNSYAQMEYNKLCGRDGQCRNFSRLVMGTDHLVQADWTIPGSPEINEDQARDVLDEAARLGINFFDTSPIYVGGVEWKLGRWMESRQEWIKNDDFFYSPRSNPDRKLYALSKGGFPFDLFWSRKLEDGEHSEQLYQELNHAGILDTNQRDLKDVPAGTYASRLFGTRQQIVDRVSEEMGHSRRNLNDQITVYLMHRDDGDYLRFNPIQRPKNSIKTILSALSDEKIAGHLQYLGLSNWTTDRVNEALKTAQDDHSLVRPSFNSPYFSLFEMSQRSIHAGGIQVTHEEMMDENFQKGINIMPYSPLGGFSILDKPAPQWENAERSALKKFIAGDAYWQNVYHALFTEVNRLRFQRVVAFTKRFNQLHQTQYTVDQMINAYALAHKRVTFLAVGPINKEQLNRTVQSLTLAKRLMPSDLNYLHSGQ